MIDKAVEAARYAVRGGGLCLPTSVLLQRILADVLPARPFELRLGALTVLPVDDAARDDAIAFDPRSDEGIDGGFHAWLEDAAGRLLDPSITYTLHDRGYAIDPDTHILDGGRRFVQYGYQFVYELVPELELVGVEESEPQLGALFAMAMTGFPAPPGTVYLDIKWRD